MKCVICGKAHAACKGTAPPPRYIVDFIKEGFMPNKNDFVSDKRLYLDADGNVVAADNPKRAKLLVAEGGVLSQEQAEKYGLARPFVEDEAAELSEFAPGGEEEEAPKKGSAKKVVSVPKKVAPKK